MQTAIYTGQVRHRRFYPKKHEFSYKVFMLWLDLDEIAAVFNKSRFWSSSGPALIRFKRTDFFGETDKPLKAAVLDWVYQQTKVRLNGPVRLLANLRYAGFITNPIACYYCYSDDGSRLEYVVAEVTNTPWGQRTHYLLPCHNMDQSTASGQFEKTLHVSPFHPMDMHYKWRLDQPSSQLNLHFDNIREGRKVFDASLMLHREAATTKTMNAIVWRYPCMTLKVFLAIYWQALKLWLKGLSIYRNPQSNAKNQQEVG